MEQTTTIFESLFILMAVVWGVAVVLRRMGLPTIMGELIMGVILGPALLGWLHPDQIIETLAEIGIFFLMLHAGIETEPREFFDALKKSVGVAVIGAIVPFAVSFGTAISFGLPVQSAIFMGLTMAATAVVITLRIFRDLGLQDTRVSRVIVASCVTDNLLTLIFFSVVLGMLDGEAFDAVAMMVVAGKVIAFFSGAVLIGYFVYPRLTFPFRSRAGKGFTFFLVVALAAGLLAEAIGLHVILGAYMAGLFFEESITGGKLFTVVKDRIYGVAYSFLGPIFFIALGFHVTFDIDLKDMMMLATLTTAVLVGQVISVGMMARQLKFSWAESLTVGVGMCGRAEMAFILASLGVQRGAIDNSVFTVLIITCFALNMLMPLMLKGCYYLLDKEKGIPHYDAEHIARLTH